MKTTLKTSLVIFIGIIFIPYIAWAVEIDNSGKINDEARSISQLDNKLDITKVKKEQPSIKSKPIKNNNKLNFTSQQLLSNPNLLKKLLEQSAYTNNVEAIKVLLPIYQQYSKKNTDLVLISEAILSKANNNYKQTIDNYRKVLANNPGHNVIRLDLAICLFENYQYEAAEDQFKKVKSLTNNPKEIDQLIDLYLNKIKQNNKWSFNVNGSYIKNSNVNNAPQESTFGNLKFEKPKQADGFLYNLNAKRNYNLKDNHYLTIDLYANGKRYFNKEINHKYAINTIHSGIGWLYKNLTTNIEVVPFMELSWRGSPKYRQSKGLDLNLSHWLTNNVQLFNNNSFSIDKYFKPREFLNGHTTYNDLGINYLVNAKLLLSSRVFYNTSKAKYDDDTYKRNGIQLGFTKEWNYGLSNSLLFTYAKKKYKGPDIFNIVRKDTDRSVRLILWHRALSFYGVTPKLNIYYTVTKSNHPMYKSKSKNIYLFFSKTF